MDKKVFERQPNMHLDQRCAWMCAVVLGACILFQKIAVPGSAGVIPLSALVIPLVCAIGLTSGMLRLNVRSCLPFGVFVAVGAVSLLFSASPKASVGSLGYLVTAQVPLLFSCPPSEKSAFRTYVLFRKLVLFVSCLALVQFLAQFVIGTDAAFFLDRMAPKGALVAGFNAMNPLAWQSPIFKSNGVLLLEPSLLSQLASLGIVLEILSKGAWWRIGIMIGALLVSYSGTGVTMLALFIVGDALARRRYVTLYSAIGGVAVLFATSKYVGLYALTSRVSEFGSTEASGWARFLSPFYYLRDGLLHSGWSLSVGRGAGTVAETFGSLSYLAFDPTWAKLLYEYGVVGTLLYVLFYRGAVLGALPGMAFALTYTYFILGGYLINTSVIGLVAVLCVWVKMPARELGRQSGGYGEEPL